MRFFASVTLGCSLKEASMAVAACLFQKAGSSSSTGTGQYLSAPAHQHLNPCGSCIPWVPTSIGFPGHLHAEASSSMDRVAQGAVWGGGRPRGLALTAWPRDPGAGKEEGSKNGHNGELSGRWDGVKSIARSGCYSHFPRTLPAQKHAET